MILDVPERLAPADTEYIVATDGACKGNPGPAGWAWVGMDGEWAAGSVPEGTNNIGELLALLRAVQYHADVRSEEHTSELQSLMRISYAVLCLNKKRKIEQKN